MRLPKRFFSVSCAASATVTHADTGDECSQRHTQISSSLEHCNEGASHAHGPNDQLRQMRVQLAWLEPWQSHQRRRQAVRHSQNYCNQRAERNQVQGEIQPGEQFSGNEHLIGKKVRRGLRKDHGEYWEHHRQIITSPSLVPGPAPHYAKDQYISAAVTTSVRTS